MNKKQVLILTALGSLQFVLLFFLPAVELPNPYLLTLLLFGFFPCLIFLIGWLCGLLCGFHWYWPIGIVACSLASILLFFDGSVWYFSLIFGAISCAACFFGSLWRKRSPSERRKHP